MKKISFLIVLSMLFSIFIDVEAEDYVTMYAPDGREISVAVDEVEAYKNVGWYETEVRTMYAPDGRTLVVKLAEIDAYKAVGWYETIEEVQRTMYAPDGRTLVIYKAETELYKSVGWYDDINDVTAVMCASDGRKITVYRSEVEAYENVGWNLTQSSKIDPSKPMVALTFDDGPMPASTGKILNVLDLYNARATFFVVGSMAVNATDMLVKMDSIGCQIGNHTYYHPELSALSSYGIASELSATSNVIYSAVGKYPALLRPPYGSQNQTVLQTAGMPSILWSIDTNDWRYRDASHVINSVLSNVSDGDIVLMHDVYWSTATAVEVIVPSLISMGFQLVTVDELARYKNSTLYSGSSYSSIR